MPLHEWLHISSHPSHHFYRFHISASFVEHLPLFGWFILSFRVTLAVAYSRLFFIQSCSVAQSCPTVGDPMDCSTPGFPVLPDLLELAQTHIHWVSNVIQPSHALSSPSPPACNLSQHQGLFQWVGSSHQVCQSIGTSPSVLPMNIWSPYCPRDSQESSPAPQFKSIILGEGRPDYYSDRYLSCFPMLVIQNNTSVNVEVQISFWISVFISLDKYPYDGLLDHMVDLLLFFLLL